MLSRCEGALPRVQEKRRSSIDESKNKNTMKNIKGWIEICIRNQKRRKDEQRLRIVEGRGAQDEGIPLKGALKLTNQRLVVYAATWELFST